jgi:hypothetical protein
MAIEMVEVRAKINIGTGLTAGTPPISGMLNHILSFNVDKARGQLSSFSASLKVRQDEVTGGILDNASVVIYAGTSSNYLSNKIFTGLIKTVTITPNRDDPSYVILNISGTDILSRLNGKKYTRRCRSSKGVWVSIDNVSRQGLRSGKLAFEKNEQSLTMWGGDVYKEDQTTSTRTATTDKNVETVKDDYTKKEVVLEAYPYTDEGGA